jgi:hypothetical protein
MAESDRRRRLAVLRRRRDAIERAIPDAEPAACARLQRDLARLLGVLDSIEAGRAVAPRDRGLLN